MLNYPDNVDPSDPSAPWNARPRMCECLNCRALVESEDSQVIDEDCGGFGDDYNDQGLCPHCAEIFICCAHCGELEGMKYAIGIVEDSVVVCSGCGERQTDTP